jgi:hypothetical protein
LGTQLFEEVDVGGDIRTVDVSEILNGGFECATPLFGESMVAEFELLASAPAIKLCGLS